MGLIVIFLGLLIGTSFLFFAKLPEKHVRYYDDYNDTLYNYTEILNTNETHLSINLMNDNQTSSISSELTGRNRTKKEIVIVYDKIAFVAFVAFVVFDVLGLPAIAICSASLFTKIISFEAQGFGQGNDVFV
jgi:hypothetical protein